MWDSIDTSVLSTVPSSSLKVGHITPEQDVACSSLTHGTYLSDPRNWRQRGARAVHKNCIAKYICVSYIIILYEQRKYITGPKLLVSVLSPDLVAQ